MDRKQAAKRHFRRLIVESLEQRKMLTVTPPIDNNDTLALADPIQLYAGVPFNVVDYIGNGSQASADVDVFRISLKVGDQLSLDIDAKQTESGSNISTLSGLLRVFDSNGNPLASSNGSNSSTDDPKLDYLAAGTGTYYVSVSSFENNSFSPGTLSGRVANQSLGKYQLHLLVLPSTSIPATYDQQYTVSTRLESTAGDNLMSLREAVEAANSSGGNSLIQFALADAERRVELLWGALQLNSHVAIQGPTSGNPLTVGLSTLSSPTRLMQIGSGANVRISNVQFFGGQSTVDGGALLINGELHLNQVEVRGNQANRGGAAFVSSAGSLFLSGVTLAENIANNGGAIFVDAGGKFIATQSTIGRNSATNASDAIENNGYISIYGSTIARNGVVDAGHQAVVNNASGTFYLLNTLIASNYTTNDTQGDFFSQGFNLVGNAGSATGLGWDTSLHDQVGGANGAAPLDGKVGTLQLQGGRTRSMLLLAGSPALDAASSFGAPAMEQRGAERNLDGIDLNDPLDNVRRVDIGATEFGTFFVNSELDTVDASPLGDGVVDSDISTSSPQITLRGAIQELNALAGLDGSNNPARRNMQGIIVLDRNVLLTRKGSDEDFAVTGDLDVFGNLQVQGFRGQQYLIDGGWGPTTPSEVDLGDRIFHALPGSTLRFTDLSIGGGRVVSMASTFSSFGGSILNDSATLDMDHVQLRGSQSNRGGAVYSRSGEVNFKGSSVVDSRASKGGAFYLESGSLTVSNSTVTRNAADAGGGVYVYTGSLIINDHSHLNENFASLSGLAYGVGGAIYNATGSVVISGKTELRGNYLSNGWHGAAIANYGQMLIEDGSDVSANGAYMGMPSSSGGPDDAGIWDTHANALAAIYNDGIMNVVDSTISDNSVGGVLNDSELTFRRTVISGNHDNHAGTGLFNRNGNMTLLDSRVENNSTPMYAPGILNFDLDAKLTVINTTFSGNTSEGSGSAIWNKHGTVNVVNSLFLENKQSKLSLGGGAIYNEGTNKLIGRTPGRVLTLAADVNNSQSILFLNGLSPIRNLPLPLLLEIEGEIVKVTSLDEFRSAVIVERELPMIHSVSSNVSLHIGATQEFIPLEDAESFRRYKLPLDVVVDLEVVTITKIQGNVAYVQRGRRGSVATNHAQPSDIWAVSGSLQVSNSSFVSNVLDVLGSVNPSRLPTQGGAISNTTSSFVAPTLINGVTFTNNAGVVGSAISNSVNVPIFVSKREDLIPQHGAKPLWKVLINASWPEAVLDTLPVTSLVVSNSVFDGNTLPSGTWTPAVAGAATTSTTNPGKFSNLPYNLEPANQVFLNKIKRVSNAGMISGGGNIVDVELNSFSFLERSVLPEDTSLVIIKPGNGLPTTPFKMRLSHVAWGQIYYEEVLVTSVTKIPDLHPVPKTSSSNPTVAITEYVELTTVRGFDGTQAIAHPKGARIIVSRNGFWQPGDKIGTLDDVKIVRITEINAPNGITKEETVVTVRDTSHFPKAPFNIHVFHQEGSNEVYEMMTVTAINGLALKVIRGASYSDPLIHPDHSRVEFDELISDRLDPRLEPLSLDRFPTNSGQLQSTSPAVENSRYMANFLNASATTSGLSATFNSSTDAYMAFFDSTRTLASYSFSDETTLRLSSVTGLPAIPFFLRIDDEIVRVTSVSSANTNVTVNRGQFGTIASDHRTGNSIVVGTNIDAQSTAIHVASTIGMPQTPFVISIGAELGRVVAINQITKTITVARGEFGTTAVTQAGGTKATYGRWLTVTPQTAYPSPPFHATLGDELVRVTAVNVPFHLLTIERGADRSTLQDHSPTVPLLYDSKGATRGFQGLGSITLQAVAQDSTQINIREIARLPKLFEVRIGNERLQVTNVVNNADGSQLLSVVRGVENTIPASYAKGSNVMILIDQSMNRRQVDGDGNGIIERDSGATESIHFGVNSFADLPDLDPGNGRIDTGTSGIVTLRAAIMESNALGGSAQIDLPAGNIIVYSPLFVSADIEIIGLAADQTTVSGSSSRIFEIASDGRLKIASVTLSGGNTVGNGGAVLVTGGSFAAQNSVIHGSSATGNGGAIASVQGSVRLTSSTLVNNIALQGGAIHNDRGSLTIASSTVSSNQAGSTAGAIYNSSGGHIHIFSSTIAFNTATSGPAGISNAGRVDIANTILANNLTSGSIFETAGPFVSQGYNLVDVAVGPIATLGQPVDQNSNFLSLANALPAGFTVPFNVRVADNEVMTVTAVQGLLLTVLRSTVSSERFSHPIGSAIRGDGFWEVGELIGTSASPIDPQLLPLELNGGSVPTHALAAGSQAIDAGNGILAKGIQTFLSSGAKIGESRLLVTSTIGLPSAPFKIRVDSESLTVTEISGHLLTVEGMSNVHRYGAIVKVLADQRAAPRIANAAGVNIFVPEGSSNGGGSDPYGYGGMGGNNGTGGSGTNNSSSSTSKMDIGAFERVTMVSLAGGQSTIAEGSPGASVPYTFTIHRDGIIDVTTTVEYVVRGLDSGLRASDFADDVVPRAFVTFSPGETVKSITLYIAGDRVVEPNEPFVVELRSFSPDLMIHHDHLLSTIIDDDYAELIISSVPTPEGITLRFIGQLSAPIQDGFELNWKTASQSAILDQDFDPSIGTLMVEGAANEWVGLDVITLSDEVVELDETLGLQISRKFPPGIANRVSVTSLATGTIKNDDTTSLSVRNITVTEGDSGNRNVAFEVTTGTNPVDVPFTVTLGASDLTATNNVDFVAATSVLSFSGQSGQTQSYVVSIVGDSSVEIDEQFVVNALSVSASGRQASINVSAGTGTIINDDGPRIVVFRRGAKETDSGEFAMIFDVTLTSPLGHPVSVTASTLAGSAVAGVDYVAKSGTLLFSGLSNQTLPFYVTIKGDTLEELDEQFEVNLSDLQASGDLYSLANGTGTIYNDDKIGFTVVVPSSIAPIPGSKPHIVAATSDLANAPPLLIQLTGASGDLPFGATLELMRKGAAEPLYHQL